MISVFVCTSVDSVYDATKVDVLGVLLSDGLSWVCYTWLSCPRYATVGHHDLGVLHLGAVCQNEKLFIWIQHRYVR